MYNSRYKFEKQLSKQRIDRIKSLEKAKKRKQEHVFIAEGYKLVHDMLGHFIAKELYLSQSAFDSMKGHLDTFSEEVLQSVVILPDNFDFKRLSLQKTPQAVIAIFEQKSYDISEVFSAKGLSLFLDQIQDPGNLGTILRTADWFGIEHVICSQGTADPFSPKVVQASMGALSRVHAHNLKCSSPEFLKNYAHRIYGTFLEGTNIYNSQLNLQAQATALLVMGNEGQGISSEVEAFIKQKITIPSFTSSAGSESLNVAIATAICLSEFKRQQHE